MYYIGTKVTECNTSPALGEEEGGHKGKMQLLIAMSVLNFYYGWDPKITKKFCVRDF